MKNDSEIMVSIIMAAYNSEKTIEKSLKSIRGQRFDQNRIEILVIDGGSTDRTREIAGKYGAQVIDNPVRLPEPAKIIGLKAAKGRYIQIMDSDEAMCRATILSERINLLESVPELKCLQGAYKHPGKAKVGPCSRYINEVGDPFSCFVYRTYRGHSMPGVIMDHGSLNHKFRCYIGHFRQNDIRPIGDSVTTMDRQYILDHYQDMIDNGSTTAAIYDRIVADTGCTAYIIGDKNYHYSSSSFGTYFAKLRFRIINNIFNVQGSGYSAAARSNKTLAARKYLFPFYTASVILPVIDGIRMASAYGHPVFLMHPVFCWYVVMEIFFQYARKLTGGRSENRSYAAKV